MPDNVAERIKKAQQLARDQRAQAPRAFDFSPDKNALLTEIQVADRKFREAPAGPRKFWFHFWIWVAIITWVRMASANLFGTMILSPFLLTGLWVVLNLPGWLSEGFQGGSRNSGGKYV